jgi:hypothetical protein
MSGLVDVPVENDRREHAFDCFEVARHTLLILRCYDADSSNKWFARKPGLARSVSSSVPRQSIVSPLVVQPSSERTTAVPLRY